MNIQALMKQAQSMQKQILDSKGKIESQIFEGDSELVNIKMNGKREIIEVKIKNDIEKDDIEILQDMIMLATNEALKKIQKEYDKIMGGKAGNLGGLF